MYKEIIDYAHRENLIPVKNRKRSTIVGYVKLDASGEYKGIAVLDKKEQKSVLVPDFGTYAATEKQANPIVEKMGYIFNWDESEHGRKHESYLADIKSGADACKSLNAIHNFLSKYESDKQMHDSVNADLQDAKINAKSIISWMIDGKYVENMESDWNGWLVNKLESMGNGKKKSTEPIISSFTGSVQESIPASASPAIRNVDKDTKAVFGVARPCYVASAKESAYQCYGFEKALGFQIGAEDADSLVAGLESLLDNDNNRNKDFKLIYYYDNNVENIIKESLNGFDEEDIENMLTSGDGIISSILSAVRSGNQPIIPEPLKNVHYYMCNFNAPTAGRYFISNESRGTYESLVSNLYKWYDDTRLSTGKTAKSITKFYNVLINCISNRNATNKSKAIDKEFGTIRNELLNAIYHGGQIPFLLYYRALTYASMTFISQSSKDGTASVPMNIRVIYAQIIKCYLNRKGYKIMPELSKNIDVAYSCGRMFATIEQLQYRYNNGRKLNKNLAQNYFSGAMKHPGTIFPVISELSIVYINNINESGKIYFNNLLGEIGKEIGKVYPESFNADEQGAFVLGYYQQKTVFFTKKAVADTDSENSEEKESEDK